MLEEMGLTRAASPEEAGLLVYNTCSIREKADTRLAGHLGLAARLKKEDSAGWWWWPVAWPRAGGRSSWPISPSSTCWSVRRACTNCPPCWSGAGLTGRRWAPSRRRPAGGAPICPAPASAGPSAWVQIMAGCSNFCSYCIVPYVRGPEASRPAAEILAEVARLAAAGVREVTFLGQNVNAYGKEPGSRGGRRSPIFWTKSCSVPGVERIRFMTSHPKDVSDALIDVMARPNQVCEHLHLPVQSGSDRILAAMRRGYDRQGYLDLVRRLRDAVPGLALTTDLIVGFPGETEADFADTLSLVEECRLRRSLHLRLFAAPADRGRRLPGRLAPEVAEERMRRLVELVQRLGRERNEALVGRTVEVMVERASRQKSGRGHGAHPRSQAGELPVDRGPGRAGHGGVARGDLDQLPRPPGTVSGVARGRRASAARRRRSAGLGLVIGLLGPTGVGKTAVGLELALRLAGEDGGRAWSSAAPVDARQRARHLLRFHAGVPGLPGAHEPTLPPRRRRRCRTRWWVSWTRARTSRRPSTRTRPGP